MSSESDMTKETSSSYTPLGLFYRHPRLIQGLSLMSSLGLLSTGLVVAQTDSPLDTDVTPQANPIPSASQPAPEPAPVQQPAPAPVVSAPEPAPLPKPVSRPAASVPAPAPAPEASAPPTVIPQKPRLAAPILSAPPPSTLATPPKVLVNPDRIQEAAQTPVAPNNTYIDRTNYNLGATRGSQGTPAVVLTERSTGCQTVSQNGRLTSGICNIPPRNQAIARSGNPLNEPQLGGIPRLPVPPVATAGSVPLQPINATSNNRVLVPTRRHRSFTGRATVPPGLAFSKGSTAPTGMTTPTGLAYYNLTTRPSGRPKITNNSFIFPLTIPASISSLFGWRIHPITGERRFHSGTDLAAPEGTPVIAAASGEVATADFLGGYGLTVILRHDEGRQESRYAHLSEIFVQPGELVDQGTVIGRVGSTGFSTGPHLHFEWRNLTTDGWVAVDAGVHLQYALAQFIEALKVAQTTPQPGS
ncbi:MAG TPA: peptidase M23 [Cyanobacteria bacterium UBA11162]|nr:peptidase M23 [Cyanobacteria bacterium UBA11162]